MLILALRSPTFLSPGPAALLFENHWVWWIVALAVAATLIFVSRTRANRRLFRAAASAVVVLLVWVFVSLLVVTPAERLQRAHHTLADAASRQDIEQILSFLAPDFSCTNLNIRMDPSAAAARDEIQSRLKEYGIHEIYITRFRSIPSQDSVLTEITFIAKSQGMGPVQTSWELRWRDFPDSDWKISSATLTAIGDSPVPPDQIIR